MKDQVLSEAKRLYQMGFGIIVLHPKSKRPKFSEWTSGPRPTWKEIETQYKDGDNIGVRLGEASKIGEHYLACIDLDIKDPEYRDQALTRLQQLTAGREFPVVKSGSGNGSRHLYCVTREPFKMITVEKHKDQWEICAYSTGRQMVLSPSVHPSGKKYVWAKPVSSTKDLPVMEFKSKDESSTEGEEKPQKVKSPDITSKQGPGEDNALRSFTPVKVDLGWLEISESMREAIEKGEGVEDRSGFLLKASKALLSAGLDENEVLSVLTDRETYLGQTGFDHAQTNSRRAAASWVYRYTFKKVLADRDPALVFTPIIGELVEPRLSEDEMKEQALDFVGDPEENGFYRRGPRGSYIPMYKELLEKFKQTKPFKSITDMNAIYVFNGTHYVSVPHQDIKGFAEEYFNPEPSELIRTEFLNKVKANCITNREFFTTTTNGKINFKNGVLDVSVDDWAQELIQHSPEYGFRGVLPFDYDPDAKCPIFDDWVFDIMMGDGALVNILQEFMGYVVRGGDYKYHKALWLGGVGRNGKSTFIDILKALVGRENYTTISIKSLVGDKFVGAELDGKIANFSEETSPQELADSGPFKNLTGDGDIQAQKKFGSPFYFRNRAKLVMTYNQIPDLKDLSKGMLSRPIIIPFIKEIKEKQQDHNIKDKMIKELPGIFNFAMKGWRRLESQRGFSSSEASNLALSNIKEESCNVYQWIENYIEFLDENTDDSLTPTRDMHSIYRRAERFSYGMAEFSRRLMQHPEMKLRYKRKTKFRGYRGLKIRG